MSAPAPPSDTASAISSLMDVVVDLQAQLDTLKLQVNQQFALIRQQYPYATYRGRFFDNTTQESTWEDSGGLPPNTGNTR